MIICARDAGDYVIKTIAIDCGGVLFTDGTMIAAGELEKRYKYRKHIVVGLLTSEESKSMHKGLMDEDAFWSWAKKNLPHDYDAEVIKHVWYDSFTLNKDVLELITELKIHYEIILFSGNTKERLQYLDKKYDFRKYFDAEVLSFEHQATKEDGKLFEALVTSARCHAWEMVCIDDDAAVVEIARAVGMTAFDYDGDSKKLRRELYKAGIDVIAP